MQFGSCCSTQRGADPQAQEPLSQWTEVWPTQPVRTQAVNRHKVGEEETPS